MLVLVDGLNLHHALKDLQPDETNLNIFQLCHSLADSNGATEIDILYFTSITKHLGSKVRDNQALYINQLENTGVGIHLGEFRSSSKTCPLCFRKYWEHSEKQTDVAIGAHLIQRTMTQQYDAVLLFSADSDFLPALLMVRNEKPHINLKVVSTPVYLRPIYGLLHKNGIGTIRLSPELVSRFQF
jgi:uncharacterized LabA/DUF88 family protein